jgi:hypothetical protein
MKPIPNVKEVREAGDMKTPLKTGRRLLEQQHKSGSVVDHGREGEDGDVIAEAAKATRLAHLAEVAALDHQEEEKRGKDMDGGVDKAQPELELGQKQENKLTAKEPKDPSSTDGNSGHVVIQPPPLLPLPSGVNEEKFRSFEETRGHLLREDLPQVEKLSTQISL